MTLAQNAEQLINSEKIAADLVKKIAKIADRANASAKDLEGYGLSLTAVEAHIGRLKADIKTQERGESLRARA